MASERIITDNPDLSVVLGELDDDVKSGVLERLAAADARLVALRDELAERSGRDSWETTGVTLETFESGQASLNGVVRDTQEEITFTLEMRPRNFFDENPWRPGQPPRRMLTDAWDLEGEVQVMRQTRISGRKYTVQESVGELPETRYESLDEAIDAFVRMCDELAELALSRDPEVAAWVEEADGDQEDVSSAL